MIIYNKREIPWYYIFKGGSNTMTDEEMDEFVEQLAEILAEIYVHSH